MDLIRIFRCTNGKERDYIVRTIGDELSQQETDLADLSARIQAQKQAALEDRNPEGVKQIVNRQERVNHQSLARFEMADKYQEFPQAFNC